MRQLTSIFGILVLAVMAAVLTEATMAFGGRQSVSVEPRATASPLPSPSPTEVSTPEPTTVPAPVPQATTMTVATPVPSPVATTKSFVRMRADRTTSSAVVAELAAGTDLTYSKVDSGLWQEVSYRGERGFVYKTYLSY